MEYFIVKEYKVVQRKEFTTFVENTWILLYCTTTETVYTYKNHGC